MVRFPEERKGGLHQELLGLFHHATRLYDDTQQQSWTGGRAAAGTTGTTEAVLGHRGIQKQRNMRRKQLASPFWICSVAVGAEGATGLGAGFGAATAAFDAPAGFLVLLMGAFEFFPWCLTPPPPPQPNSSSLRFQAEQAKGCVKK